MSININGYKWVIRFVKPYDPILDGALGVTIPEWRAIYIADDIGGELLFDVICHEVAHAEFASRGLIVPIYIEEVLADIVANNISDVRSFANTFCNYCGKC